MRPEDRRFIADFGARMDLAMSAGVLFTQQPLYVIVDVYFNLPRGTVFHVAVGPGRVMYVIMPWKGEEVLCRGMIWPYHEIEESRILTNADWEERLRARRGNRPALPAWLRQHAGERGDE
jgi:hypothetical protein